MPLAAAPCKGNWNHRFVSVDQQVIADQLEATTAAQAESLSGLGITSVEDLKAAELAKGATPLEAARTAKAFVTAGIKNRVVSGAPFTALWQGGAAN